MLSQGPKLPDFIHVQNRVSFMRYDFFQPQPIESAGLFFLRQIAHNYPDDVCINIFKNFVPALEKCGAGTSLLLNDMVLPQANTVPKVEEHLLRQLDMAMLNSYAAKQRTLKEFTKLLHEADPRLEVSWCSQMNREKLTPSSTCMTGVLWVFWRCSFVNKEAKRPIFIESDVGFNILGISQHN